MKHPRIPGLAVVMSLAACTATPTILPTNDLNRPTDIAFMCLGAFETTASDGTPTGTFDVSGRPMSVCHPPPVNDAKAMQPKVSIQNRTFAFVSNSASGDLSVVDADTWKIIDLNKATGGFGRLPLGALPEQISTTSDGCRLVSANRGSCNLSLVDPSALLAPMFAAQYDSTTTGVSVNVPAGSPTQTIAPHWDDANQTPLGAAPYEAVFLPQDTSQINNCPSNGAGPATPWRALVTFPSCNLIALVDLPSGNIVSSVRAETITITVTTINGDETLTSVKLVDAGTHPTCSAECGGGRADGDAADGGTAGTAPRPTGIAIWPDATRAYVSFANVPAILPIGLSPTGLVATAPADGIPLHEGAQGSNRIRLGVDPWGIKTDGQAFPGRFIGDGRDRAYLYVIARDGSLRIIDVFDPGTAKECETNFDTLDPGGDGTVDLTANNRCIPYGSVKRRPYSQQSAGLRFPTFPVDVAVADMGRVVPGGEGDHREDTVAGAYAWVLTANGLIYLVNIDPVQRSIKAVVHQGQDVLFDPDPARVAAYKDDPFVYKSDPTTVGGGVLEPPPFPNRPRDRNFLSYSVSLDPALGLVRVDIPPVVSSTAPYIEPLWTQGTEANATVTDAKAEPTYVFFPDRDGAVAQAWDVTWQGTLVSPRYSGVLRGNLLRDGGGGFCTAGVQVGDIVTLNGCTTDAGCPLGMVCKREATLDQVPGGFTVTGLCVSSNQPSLDVDCAPYVNTVRRYEIVEANNSQLRLKPHLDEVVRSSLTECVPGEHVREIPAGCTGTGGMGGGAGAAGTGGGGAGMGGTGGTGGSDVAITALQDTDCVDPIDSSTQPFKCVQIDGQRPRCLDPCTRQQDCRQGRICPRKCDNKENPCPSGQTCNGKDGMCQTGQTCTETKDCGNGDPRYQTCVPSADGGEGHCEINSFCADAPELGKDSCFPQLTGYQVSANAGYIVSGSQAGSFAYGIETDAVDSNGDPIKVCTADPNRDPRLVSRIPLRPRPPLPGETAAPPIECDKLTQDPKNVVFPNLTTDKAMTAEKGFFIDHFDPRLAPVIDDYGLAGPLEVGPYTITQESTQLLSWMNDWTTNLDAPNACIYMAGPVQGDASSTTDPSKRYCRPQHVRARLRNSQIGFVIANLDRGPSNSNPIHFEVHGGFRPQAVVLPTTVEISAPARLVLGPIDSNQEAKVTPGPAPFFFVVDQRRLGRGQGGGPTRGQIIRVNPFGLAANGYLPIYEDYSRSGNLFPIQ